MNKFFFISFSFVLFATLSCSHLQSSTRNPSGSSSRVNTAALDLPNRSALMAWQDIPGYQTMKTDVDSFPSVAFSCDDQNLYPTHPQQMNKIYHLFKMAYYDRLKLQASDSACTFGAKEQNASGIFPCLKADSAEYAIISDTFQDSCGHVYRAAWQVAFAKRNDNMGMLFSKGRTLYPRPNSSFENDMYVAQTYAVPVRDFLFITSPFAGDLERIEQLRKASSETHTYDPSTHLFSVR